MLVERSYSDHIAKGVRHSSYLLFCLGVTNVFFFVAPVANIKEVALTTCVTPKIAHPKGRTSSSPAAIRHVEPACIALRHR